MFVPCHRRVHAPAVASRWLPALAVLLLAAGCQPAPASQVEVPLAAPSPSIEAPTAPPVALGPPAVDLVQGEAEASAGEQPLEALPETMAPGDAIAVAEGGLVVLRWAEGLRAELLGGSRARLEVAGPDGAARLVQTAGMARYSVMADGTLSPGLVVEAGAVTVRADGEDDAIVGFDEDAEGTTWVLVTGGTVTLAATGADDALDDALGTTDQRPSVAAELPAGHAIAFGGADRTPIAMPVERPSIEAWYASALTGSAPPIARAAFRCVVREGEPVRLLPVPSGVVLDAVAGSALEGASVAASDQGEVGDPLASGTLLEVAARDEAARWLQVTVVPAGGLQPRTLGLHVGWVEAAAVDCVGPLAGVLAIEPMAPAAAAPAPVPAAGPTATPGPATFVADRTAIASGDCVLLSWDIPAGTAVTLNGHAVAGKGQERSCPEVRSAYRLAWIAPDGRPVERLIEVDVSAAVAAAGGSDAGAGQSRDEGPPAEPTPCATECAIELPTLMPEPTRRPRPTATPRPAVPTSAPEPTRAPEPTDAPQPTRPSQPTRAPEPTDEPQPTATAVPSEPTATAMPPEPTATAASPEPTDEPEPSAQPTEPPTTAEPPTSEP